MDLLTLIRKNAVFGSVTYEAKNGAWFLMCQVRGPSGNYEGKVYVWGNTFQEGLENLLDASQKEYDNLLEKARQGKQEELLFEE